jgi:hypothetical protein
MSYLLICPPVTPFSPVEKIQKWLDYLMTMPEQEASEVKKAIADAELMLKRSIDLYQSTENKTDD